MREYWIFFGIASSLTTLVYAENVVLCYMAAWSVGRQGPGKFSVLDADTDHCTHIVYAFMGLDGSTNEIKSIDAYIDQDAQGLGQNQLIKLKQLKYENPNVKLLVSIGGWNEEGKKFSDMARSAEKRQIFIRSVKQFLSRYELDGLDICWQFPGLRGGKPEDKENSITLFRELKDAFEWENWLLTVHIIGKRYVMDAYDIKAVSDIVDYINLATVEYNGPWERKTGPMAPLTSKNELNVQFSVDYMIKQGAAQDKLLLGLPTYGHAYLLPEPPTNQYIGLFSNETFASQWTQEFGITGYHETCFNMKNTTGWHAVWDADSQTPLAYNGKKLISYDNVRSLLLKADLVKSRLLAGVMIWSLDMDDFRGNCQGVKYPLVKSVAHYINSENGHNNSVHNLDILTQEDTSSSFKPDLDVSDQDQNAGSTSMPEISESDDRLLLDTLLRNNKLNHTIMKDLSLEETSNARITYSWDKVIISALFSFVSILLFY